MTRRLLILALAAVPLCAQTITSQERETLINHLEKTRKLFLESLTGVSDGQWNFKQAPERWSVGECAEHITLTENMLFEYITGQVLKTPAAASASTSGRSTDEEVLKTVVDRSKKGKAPEVIQPGGKFTSQAALIEEFNRRRDHTIEYVRTTQEDLRSHLIGKMDGYQYLLMLSGHSQRHTLQIQEVKADSGYPKN